MPTGSGSTQTYNEVFRRTALRVLAAGLGLAVVAALIGVMCGGEALLGVAWGAGAGIAITLATAGALWIPWERFPLLASSGVMVSFALKILIMVVVLLVAGPQRESFSPAAFFFSFAVIVLAVVSVEIHGLATGRVLTVQPEHPAMG